MMSLELSNQIKKDSLLTSGRLSFRCLHDISLPTGIITIHNPSIRPVVNFAVFRHMKPTNPFLSSSISFLKKLPIFKTFCMHKLGRITLLRWCESMGKGIQACTPGFSTSLFLHCVSGCVKLLPPFAKHAEHMCL